MGTAAPDVVVIRWPEGADVRERLRRARQPRLLVLAPGGAPPDPVDELEDWVRVPLSDVDLRARVAWLEERLGHEGSDRPTIDRDGTVHAPMGSTRLTPTESRAAQLLIERYGAIVSRASLEAVTWPDGPPASNALDAHIGRLRQRLAPIGLVIRTVRGRGFALGPAR
jgi:DNA-binding response OmpR family regulator